MGLMVHYTSLTLLIVVSIALSFTQGCVPVPYGLAVPFAEMTREDPQDFHWTYGIEVSNARGQVVSLKEVQRFEELLIKEGFVFTGSERHFPEGALYAAYEKKINMYGDSYSASISYTRKGRDLTEKFSLSISFCDSITNGEADKNTYMYPESIIERIKAALSETLDDKSLFHTNFYKMKDKIHCS